MASERAANQTAAGQTAANQVSSSLLPPPGEGVTGNGEVNNGVDLEWSFTGRVSRETVVCVFVPSVSRSSIGPPLSFYPLPPPRVFFCAFWFIIPLQPISCVNFPAFVFFFPTQTQGEIIFLILGDFGENLRRREY